MNGFQSEAYKNYLESHTRLNNFTKIFTVAIDFLYNSIEDEIELSELINDLILRSGERWTPRVIKSPQIELENLKNDLIKSAIIWVYSAFDVYFRQIEGILSTHFEKQESNSDEDEDDDDYIKRKTHKVTELYTKLNWDISEVEDLIIVLKFYDAIRHSVAHESGKPSRELIEIANDNRFKESIRNWKTKFPKKSISPPPIVTNVAIQLKPHHSILYSETCLRIASDINNKLFTILGEKYFINKIIKIHLLEVGKLTEPECQNLTRYLVYHLKNDYNISVKPYEKVFTDLSTEKIAKYKKRYHTLKNIN
ncbi:hypothetical protein [Fibrivirga algicola]|uniref:RiboL-PSP-HEPN domain-containing protein n=1 Tax=Fibrivirga algicola TaxID=2950420 RepID=A0ABX0QA68_9BACT|nr:hypothetical protein [Fibrivirga algicola]NID08836.1 hypothetical protein [Fibrivirga algicola]